MKSGQVKTLCCNHNDYLLLLGSYTFTCLNSAQQLLKAFEQHGGMGSTGLTATSKLVVF